MKRIAVIGGGPAGAVAAQKLAAGGLNVTVFDEKLAWEKPCGGGLTARAYNEYPFLIENNIPKKPIKRAVLSVSREVCGILELPQQMLIYSRYDLNRMLLDRAVSAGTTVEKTRVIGIEHQGGRWRLLTKAGVREADFCILANGARNSFRDFGARLKADDIMLTRGYQIPGDQDDIDIVFLPNFEGYIWIFPRCGHLSVGICGKREPNKSLRERLDRFMAERGMDTQDGTFYSHVLPALSPRGWREMCIAGSRWMAVGDAAGLVDPITGEGIYYAIKSGDLAADCLLVGEHQPGVYEQRLKAEFADDLAFGSLLAPRLFRSHVLFRPAVAQAIRLMRHSSAVRSVFTDIFTGYPPYRQLRSRLLNGRSKSIRGTLVRRLLARVIPKV